MTPLRESIRSLFSPAQPVPAGMYHFQSPPEDPRNYRLHLRIEPDGSSILIVNAATILHLNQTASEYAFYLVQNTPPDQAARNVASRYRVSQEQARTDYQNLVDRIQTLIDTPDLDPDTFLDFERHEPFSGQITAPYRMDCALTYRLPAGSRLDSAPMERVDRELNTIEWKEILEKAWTAGIPHIVFTGGEPTLRDDLADLIAAAELNSQVTGLITDGLRLADADYLNSLLQTGLDHLMIVLQPEKEPAWQGLKNALEDDVFVAVHLTLTQQNAGQIPENLQRLAQMGVKAVSLSTSDSAMSGVLHDLRSRAAHLGMELVWNLPVPYSDLNPISLETEDEQYTQGAGRAWLYVEPDGDVLPAQGGVKGLGNILREPWEKIWKNAG